LAQRKNGDLQDYFDIREQKGIKVPQKCHKGGKISLIPAE